MRFVFGKRPREPISNETFKPSPAEKREVSVWVRNPALRKRALYFAEGRCQICKRPGFHTGRDGVAGRYLEVHDLRPPHEKLRFVIATCATCHRKYHHGSPSLRRSLPTVNPLFVPPP